MRPLLCSLMVLLLAGCGGKSAEPYRPVRTDAAVFWDRQITENADMLKTIVGEFNAARPGQVPIVLEFAGGHTEIFRKVTASIQARVLPAMSVAYESMTAEYIQSKAVVALDAFVDDPQLGLSAQDRADFFPVFLESSRYPEAGGRMYSFPFCKSVMMLFFNKAVMAKAGIAEPPGTWDDFLAQCRKIKAATGGAPFALSIDASIVDGIIFSMGGDLLDGRVTLYDQPSSIRAFELIETMAREGLVYQISPGSYDDQAAFVQDTIAFFIRTSSARSGVIRLMADRMDQWGMTRVPQTDPANPKTVLYGPNVNIFNVTPEEQRAAWEFIKYFTSPAVSARWAVATGYIPIRKSVVDDPVIQRFWAEWPYNRAAYDCLPFALSEPRLAGWQEVRIYIERAETEVLTKMKSGAEAARALKQRADAVLAAP